MWEKRGTGLSGLYVIEPFSCEDNRGDFTKIFEMDIFESLELPNVINEIFASKSKPKVVRGLHFQYHNPQTKYVSVIEGKVFDVAVDLRLDSETFGKWHAEELSGENHRVFAIPAGFAHGFQVLGDDDAIVLYQNSGKYDKESDTGIIWDDVDIGIQWPTYDGVIVSPRDAQQMSFETFKNTIKGI